MFRDLTLILVSDDPLVRAGLVALLPEQVRVARAVGSDGDLGALLEGGEVEVVLVDGELDELRLGVPVVVLARSPDEVDAAWAAGAAAVVRRDVSPEALCAALVAVRAGLRADDAQGPPREPVREAEEVVEPLTPREEEVLGLLAEGRSNREIALALEISTHTAKFHVDRLLGKLGASGRTDAVVRAVRLGLLRL